jgi:hypothetical protein
MITGTDIRTVTLTVDGIRGNRESRNGGTQLSVYAHIPALGSQYPTGPLWVDEANMPVVGNEYTVQIRKGNLKKDKDGSRDWDYWWEVEEWDVQGVAPDPAQPRQAPAQPSSEQQGRPGQAPPAQAPQLYVDPTRVSIERQTSAKEATQILLNETQHSPEMIFSDQRPTWSAWADHIYEWISMKPAGAKPEAESPVPEGDDESGDPAFDALPAASDAPAGEVVRPFANTGQLLSEAGHRWGKNKFECYTALGLAEIDKRIPGELEVAWKTLEEAFGE